jgi:Protein of unknown function (DUF3591)
MESSPFLGEVEPGGVQTALCNDLYRAPLFEHRVSACCTELRAPLKLCAGCV